MIWRWTANPHHKGTCRKKKKKSFWVVNEFLKNYLAIVFRFNEDEDDEDHSSFSTLDHIRHFSMEDGDLSDSDVGNFGPAHLQEGIKQPLYRKSKSQVSPWQFP